MKSLLSCIVFILIKTNLISQVSFTLSNNVCSGNTKTVSANTGTDIAVSYTWASNPPTPSFSYPYSASTSINFPVAGSFSITLNVTLLSGLETYSNIVTVAATPTVTVAPSNTTSCATDPVILWASGANSYTWSLNAPPSLTGQENPKTVRPATTDCYTVTGSVGACTNFAISCIIVYDCTGLPSNYLRNEEIHYHPNPVKDKLNIDCEENKIEKISISNCFGQIVYTLYNPTPKQEIDLSSFSRGIYNLKSESKQGQRVYKIIKE